MLSSGVVDYEHYGIVTDSYGRKSPGTNDVFNAWPIIPSGDIYVDHYDVRDSSYEHSFDRLFQNSIIFVAKIAEHGLRLQRPRLAC